MRVLLLRIYILSIWSFFFRVFIYDLFVACFSFNWRGWYVVRLATFIHKKFYIFMEKCRLWRSFFFPRIHIIIIIVLNIYYVRQIKMGKVSKYMLEPLHLLDYCLLTRFSHNNNASSARPASHHHYHLLRQVLLEN